MNAPFPIKPAKSARPPARPGVRGVLAGTAVVLAVLIASAIFYWQATRALQSEVHDNLRRSAMMVAQSIDADAHRTFTVPAQESTPAYARAIQPLERVLRLARPDGQGNEYKNAYTAILAPDGPHFVLDGVPSGDADKDGVDDKSHIMQRYEEATEALRLALTTGTVQADSEPYRDRWGVFVSGYGPFFDSAGKLVGVVGLDLKADDYMARLSALRRSAWLQLAVGALLGLAAGALVYTFEKKAAAHRALIEAARAEAEDRRRRLAEVQHAVERHCLVLECDPAGAILRAGDYFLRSAGYTAEELAGRPLSQVFPASALLIENQTWPQLRSGQPWQGPLRLTRRDGDSLWFNASIFPLLDAEGRPERFIAMQSDITELVHARETAEAAVKAKSEFLAMMSHEIRTPMNGVLGFANLLADSSLDDQQREYVRTIVTSGDSLLTIINDILDFSKLEAGRTELENRPVAIRHVIEDVLDLLVTGARGKGLDLVYWMAPGVPEGFLGDETRLRQILLNLAGNAVKFTAKGTVEISVVTADRPEEASATTAPFPLSRPPFSGLRQLTFHVRDTGIGIPPDKIDRLFRAFSQVDSSVTRTHGGTGLGLAISARLVGVMGGEIGITSEPGRGSDFHFTLPCEVADVAQQIRERAPLGAAEITAVLGGRRLLVIDDIALNRRLFEKILTHYKVQVTALENAAQALTVLETQPFDLVLLDYMMPQIDGIALAEQIRRTPGTARLPLVLVSSMIVPAGVAPEGLFAAIVTKPLRNLQFVSLLARLLGDGQTVPTSAALPAAAATQRSKFALLHPHEILIVEDNPVNLRLITVMLRTLGYDPATATNGAEALTVLAGRAFDLVLMDVQMPVLDGFAATRAIRAGEGGELNRATRVVALTANASHEDRDACIAAGMNDFLSKPIERPRLLEILSAK